MGVKDLCKTAKAHTSYLLYITGFRLNALLMNTLCQLETLKEFQFVRSLKLWQSMVYTVCHTPIPMTS